MFARVTTLQLDPGRLDLTAAELEEESIPAFKQIAGFRGFTLLIDRASGTTVGISYWNSKEEMAASEEAVKDARQSAADTGGSASEPQIERFEVAVDQMV